MFVLNRNYGILPQFFRTFKIHMYSYSEWSSCSIFNPQRVLILTKLSRYDFEKQKHHDLTELELKKTLTERGSDYHMLRHRHNMHKNVENSVSSAFQEVGIDTRIVNRFDYTDANINWADAVVTTGGDGTYLLAASRITNSDKPVIGFNSDPSRSKGQLCLPEKYSYNVKEAIEKLLKGMFRWQFRSRVRISLMGKDIHAPPVELHEQQLLQPENRYLDIDQQLRAAKPPDWFVCTDAELQTRVLPVLALNEVFIGECVSARVSYLEMTFDDNSPVKQKCSGLIVSTGTGSTSWTYNVNKLTQQSLEQILNIAQEQSGVQLKASSKTLIRNITDKFNELLLNDPEDNRLVYTIRDQLVPPSPSIAHNNISESGISDHANRVAELSPPNPDTFFTPACPVKPRGFCQKIHVRSRCFDACLVIDGGMSFTFNDGTRALLEMHPEDCLRNVILDESDLCVSFKH